MHIGIIIHIGVSEKWISLDTLTYPTVIVIRLGLQETVDRNWLDVSPTPYLLDSIVKLECGQSTRMIKQHPYKHMIEPHIQ